MEILHVTQGLPWWLVKNLPAIMQLNMPSINSLKILMIGLNKQLDKK